MRYDKFELSVAVPSNRGLTKIPEYGHGGLTFVEGRRGQFYSLKLRNDTAGRVMAVISIDGRSVLDGEACTPQSRGYVIPAYSTVDINGWRTNLNEVRNFYFTEKDQSYTKGVGGEVQNCGVIAAKFFSEKPAPVPQWIVQEHHHHHHHDHYEPIRPPYWPHYPKWPYPDIMWSSTSAPTSKFTCDSNNLGLEGNVGPAGCEGINVMYTSSTPMSSLANKGLDDQIRCCVNNVSTSQVPEFKLGTGWGEARVDQVTETAFERDRELCTLSIYYAESSDLERVGIKLVKELAVTPPAPVLPQAFAGFCKPPVNR